MASGRPRQPNDPSVMASVEAAMSTVARPRLIARMWHWRYERITARAWCVITPHRVRTGCAQAWIHTRDGHLPAVLYTVPARFGERVWLWCRAGITARDLEAARDVLRAACWASDVRVVVNDRRSHIVVLEVIRRLPPDSPDGGTSGWPYLDRGDASGTEPEEPALCNGLG
jgi:hypothetical protein